MSSSRRGWRGTCARSFAFALALVVAIASSIALTGCGTSTQTESTGDNTASNTASSTESASQKPIWVVSKMTSETSSELDLGNGEKSQYSSKTANEYTFNERGDIATSKLINAGDNSVVGEITYEVDDNGYYKTVKTVGSESGDIQMASSNATYKQELDDKNRATRQIVTYDTGESYDTTYEYDDEGRISKVAMTAKQKGWTSQGNETMADVITTTTYNKYGFPTAKNEKRTLDGVTTETAYTYEYSGDEEKPTSGKQVAEIKGGPTTTTASQFTYDANGNITKLVSDTTSSSEYAQSTHEEKTQEFAKVDNPSLWASLTNPLKSVF